MFRAHFSFTMSCSAAVPVASTQTQAVTPEVRFISVAPSPYSHRHDSMRAGFGIFLSLQRIIAEEKLPIRVTYYDGAAVYDSSDQVRKLVRGADVLIIGGSTWAQGSALYLRRFMEYADAEPLYGVQASAWATAGGTHTGGELVYRTRFDR